MMDKSPFSRLFDVRRVGESAVVESVVADAAERAAIVADFGLFGLDRLEAALTIRPWQRIGVKLEGRLIADAVQACVVTLEPVREVIDQPFTLTFMPPRAGMAAPRTVGEAEVIVAVDEDDPPDLLEGNVIDLGAIVAEQLALALDPYPRAPGADLAAELGMDDEAAPSPFAALSTLKRDS